MDFSKLFSLEGRVAVVTGGSRGIGAMIAEGFIAAGCARVYITARKAAVVAETAARLGERCIALPGDIATVAGIAQLAADLAAREDKIDILVNPLAWPKTFTMDNFTQALEKMDFFRSLTNSVIITVFSVGGLIIFSSMLAYYLARNKNKFTKTTFLILVASMIVPFQALMIAKSAVNAVSIKYNFPLNSRISLPTATSVPTPAGVKKAGIPAPPARIRSAKVP